MGDTVHITVRIGCDVVAQLREEALRVERGLGWVITRRLRESYGNADSGATGAKPAGSVERSGNGAAVPAVRTPQGEKERQERNAETLRKWGREQSEVASHEAEKGVRLGYSHNPKTCRIYGCLLCKEA